MLNAVDGVKSDFPAQTDERSPVENPLLLSCVLQVYATYRRLPDDAAKLYHDMVRVLCEAKIRAADDRARDTLVEEYQSALRELFLACQEFGSTRLGVTAAHELLVDRNFVSRSAAENWLRGLANHTGLVRFEGTGDHTVIPPWHRSYQEYLAAESIALTYANRATECIAWLRSAPATRGPRLSDPAWRGTLRFLIGAAVHQKRDWGVDLLDALGPVSAFPRGHTPEGIWDMAGNVFEWCASRRVYGMIHDLPVDMEGGPEARILRGGCWRSPIAPLVVRGERPGQTDDDIGFRFICRPLQATPQVRGSRRRHGRDPDTG
ncbi:MAG TPA: SUMF1/EgtB/PvdO family nonheme iron enzyme [Kofleriaceae bacterium]